MYEQMQRSALMEVRAEPPDGLVPDGASAAGVLVFAIGNPLRGDDGVGPAILERLASTGALPEDVVLLCGDAWTLASALQTARFRRAILVDAMELGGGPGTWKRYRLNDAPIPPDVIDWQAATHTLNLNLVLSLLKTAGWLLPEIVIYGVQPLEMNWSPRLSEPVQEAVPLLYRRIMEDLQSDIGCQDFNK